VKAGDTFETGAGARVQLRTADGSTVKLGENAALAVPTLRRSGDGADRVLQGALKVLKGAFRFTTTALGRDLRRDYDVNIGGVITAGIRGTDVWGKSGDGQNLICLLEGKIRVSSPKSQPVEMDEAGTFYVVPDGQPPKPIVPVPADKLETWAAQTEIPAGAPAQSDGGNWTLALGAESTPDEAGRVAALLSDKGYAVEVTPVEVGGAKWNRLVLPGFRSAGDARQLIPQLEQELKLKGVWVPRRRESRPR
jgi:cell division septation protein DedD